MHADMSIPKIPAYRGISLASNDTFRIYDFKNVVDKTTSGSKPLFSFEELKGKTTDVQNWKKMSYDIFMEGKINLNSLVKTELRYSNF